MERKNITILLLLIGVLGLAIGYALTTTELKIEGTATAKENASSFDVNFTNAQADLTQVTGKKESSASITQNTKIANMVVTLTEVGDSQTCTFTISNDSQAGIGAKITATNVKIYAHGTTTSYDSEYFAVTTNISSGINIPSITNNTRDITVTVTLKKAYVGETIQDVQTSESFDIVLESISSYQET